jgi:hypothetical protein
MTFLRLIFFLICCALLTACSTAERPNFSTHLEIIVSENGFSAPRWHIPAEETIQLTVTNQSADNITLYFLAPSGSKVPGEAWFSLQISPGESKQTSFTAPAAAGEYDITAERETDLQSSLYAEIVVVQP